MKYPSLLTKLNSTAIILLLSRFAIAAADQSSSMEREREFISDSGSGSSWPYYLIFSAILVGVAFFIWNRSKRSEASQFDYSNRVKSPSERESSQHESVDAEKELEWFRKAKKVTSKADRRDLDGDRRAVPRRFGDAVAAEFIDEMDLSARAFQEKMRKIQYGQLPVNSFIQLTDARSYEPLPLSADPALLCAIDQAQDEFEDDEAVREIAVKVLAAFRNRNSVEAMSQIALYDLSSNLRSKAVNTLTEFDHESVFETILLACADPTREVRAAAARGLFRLGFDRAEAWKRIIATGDQFRMSHAARAAIESGIVTKSFDRLLHEDMKIAYEAFVLIALVIKSGEMDCIFSAIKANRDDRVKLALLHVIQVVRDPVSFDELSKLRSTSFSPEVTAKLKDAIEAFESVMA